MAKLKGPIKVKGTLGEITFAKTKDGYIAKEKTSLSGQRIATDPNFKRTRENNSEFGRAIKAGKLIGDAIRPLLQQVKDKKLFNRLSSELMKVIRADTAGSRGMRTITAAGLQRLKGFDFNSGAKLSSSLPVPFTTSIDRATGNCRATFEDFVPAERVKAPASATHFKIVSAAAELDFVNAEYRSAMKESAVLPVDTATVNALNLSCAMPVNSVLPILQLLGIQFYQQVNGVNYPLTDLSFNALSLAEINTI